MKTLLLVAGQSKRFWPLKEKPLFPICGKPLIGHVIERLKEAGCGDIVLIGSTFNLDAVHALHPKLPLVKQEDLALGMRGALLSALPTLGETDVLVVSSNDVVDAEAYKLTLEAGKHADGAMLAKAVDRYFPGGYLSVEGDRVTGIVEKPGEGKEPSNLVTVVCHYHRSASTLLAALNAASSSKDDGYEQALASLFATHRYLAVPFKGNWQAVKYPWHLLSLLPLFLRNLKGQSIHKTASIHPSAVIEGNVVMGEGVRVLPHAAIVGPCVIGDHTIIGNNALVRGSSVGNHCVIGYNTEVKSSILADHVWTHSTYIGDSVIGENVSFGAGSITGNLRLDEGEIFSNVQGERMASGRTKFGAIVGAHTRIGIQVGISPGVKIGGGTFVASKCLLEEDVPDRMFVRVRNGELVLKENNVPPPKPEERSGFRQSI